MPEPQHLLEARADPCAEEPTAPRAASLPQLWAEQMEEPTGPRAAPLQALLAEQLAPLQAALERIERNLDTRGLALDARDEESPDEEVVCVPNVSQAAETLGRWRRMAMPVGSPQEAAQTLGQAPVRPDLELESMQLDFSEQAVQTRGDSPTELESVPPDFKEEAVQTSGDSPTKLESVPLDFKEEATLLGFEVHEEFASATDGGGGGSMNLIAIDTDEALRVNRKPTGQSSHEGEEASSTRESMKQGDSMKVRKSTRASLEELARPLHDLPWSARIRKELRKEWIRLVDSLQEPERSGRIHDIVTSVYFENVASSVICFNAIFVAITSDWEMRYTDSDPPFMMRVVEMFLFICYVSEVMLRIAVHRLYFFVNGNRTWNVIDFTLACMSGLDLLVSTYARGGHNLNVSFMRFFRLLKLAKVFRTFRVMRVFNDLAVILDSFRKSIAALFWSLVMLLFVIYVFALIFVQGLTGYLKDSWDGDLLEERLIRKWFGTVLTTMLTLYQSMTGGTDWGPLFRTVGMAGPFYKLLFLTFTFVTFFAVFNILTGVFVEKAVVAAQPEREEVIMEEHRKQREDSEEFKHMCRLLDENNTGTITRDEVEHCMENELMISYMSAIGLHVRDKTEFFDMVGMGDGEIAVDKFVDGCMAMRGHATYLDFLKLMHEVSSLKSDFVNKEAAIHSTISRLSQQLDKLDKAHGRASLVRAITSKTTKAPCISVVTLAVEAKTAHTTTKAEL